MAFKYIYKHDVFRGAVLDSKGVTLKCIHSACYGGAFSDIVLNSCRTNLATHYAVYINDSLTNHYKTKDKTLDFISLIESTGLLRYTSVSWVDSIPFEDDNWYLREFNNKGFMLELKTDISKSSAEEMFLVGTVMRMLATNPDVVMSFLRLCKWFKSVDVSLLFIISNSLTFTNEAVNYGRGHYLVPKVLSYVSGKTFKDALLVCNAQPTLKQKTSSYPYSIGQEEFFGVLRSNHTRLRGAKYSKGVLESYLSLAGNIKWQSKEGYQRL